jgi:hypothetical protein
MSSPIRQFHMNADALPFLNTRQAKYPILADAGTLNTSTGSANAAVTLTLRNTSGEALAILRDPPLGAAVELYTDATLVFEGSVTQVDFTPTDCKVTVTP